MKKTELSNEKLDRIIKLREKGASWLRIQHETDTDRRVAKRAYREWQQKGIAEEFGAIRQEMAREDFQQHREQLVALAGDILQLLLVPRLRRFADNAEARLGKL